MLLHEDVGLVLNLVKIFVFTLLLISILLYTLRVDNLGASIAIFLLPRALLTVVSFRYANTTTDDALERPVVAFVTHPHQRAGLHARVTNYALAIVLTQTADTYPRQLLAHDQTWMVLCHDSPTSVSLSG